MATSYSRNAKAVLRAAPSFTKLTDEELRERSIDLKLNGMYGRAVTKSVEPFCLVKESIRRTLGKNYHPVQLEGGIAMAHGAIAEMKTGEGKTITAALPAFVHGLSGLGCHVVTVNEYLARRDFELLTPVFARLGMSCGLLEAEQPFEQRQAAYRKDITYGTAKDFGFDFLRDRLSGDERHEQRRPPIQRPLYAALVDEADSILIDEARTPLIISEVDEFETSRLAERLGWAASHVARFVEGMHFDYQEDKQRVALRLPGIQLLQQLPQCFASRQVSSRELIGVMERAILVHRNYHRDQQYAIRDGAIVIIDEFTGRPAEGRQWQNGIHQSVEAKEKLPLTPETEEAASVTVQHFFRLYRTLCGMTGTAHSARNEFRRVYKKRVVQIATHEPVRRTAFAPVVYRDKDTKIAAVVAEVADTIANGRAVLVGTRSVETSERVSRHLDEAEIPHRVLNARHLESEAEIVAQAGQPAAVTVATNMAGRGTDIMLHPDVEASGGLHVILTEIHENARIDQQLYGRCGRQGDPGSYRIFVSLEDEILQVGFSEKKAAQLASRLARNSDATGRLPESYFGTYFRAAQSRSARRHFVDRVLLRRYDQERHKSMQESGQDFYLDAVR